MRLILQISTAFTILVLSLSPVHSGGKPDSTNGSWFSIRPVDSITFRSYYLETNHPVKQYLLVNSDGDTIDRGMNLFTEVSGYGSVLDRLTFTYRLQNRNVTGLAVKRASAKLSLWGMSLEYGLMNTWFGYGYHGSLLLSNNADPMPMFIFKNEKPLRVRYIGRFEYTWVNAFPKGIRNIMTHRLVWSPAEWLRIGGNQNIFYTKDHFNWYEFPEVMTGINANFTPAYMVKNVNANVDMRATVDIRILFNSLDRFVYPIRRGGIYFEYGGEDMYTVFKEHYYEHSWRGPFGFEFLHQASLGGLWFETEKEEVRVEYAQTYRTVFYWSSDTYKEYGKYTTWWYRTGYPRTIDHPRIYMNDGNIMGHHVGAGSDIWYMHYKRQDGNDLLRVFYSFRRRDIVPDWLPVDYPEKQQILGIEAARKFGNLVFTGQLEWHTYENVDQNPNPLSYDIVRNTQAGRVIVGLAVRVEL